MDDKPTKAYRVFDKIEYAESFCRGEVWFRTLEYFKNTSDETRADPVEGSGRVRRHGEKLIVDTNAGAIESAPGVENLTVQANIDEHFVYCLTRCDSGTIPKTSKFGKYLVLVESVDKFESDIQLGMQAHSDLSRFNPTFESGIVRYDKGALANELTSVEELELAWRQKPPEYLEENEYRLHFQVCLPELIGGKDLLVVQLPHQANYLKIFVLE